MDLNLLVALDVLLQEVSVTKAAERLGTSPAAMSRKLSSLRRIVGDPLLVRSGQRMTPTDRALELRAEARALVERAESMLTSTAGLDLATLRRTFTVQAADLVLVDVTGPLIQRIHAQAPAVDVVFLPESLENTPALRQGFVDVELIRCPGPPRPGDALRAPDYRADARRSQARPSTVQRVHRPAPVRRSRPHQHLSHW
jgi:DNA-binding transcriptional LysR family regulator